MWFIPLHNSYELLSYEFGINQNAVKDCDLIHVTSSYTILQVYTQLAEDDKIRYENEMRSWEQQMKASGRGDVLNYKFKLTRKRKKPETDPLS